MDLLRHVNISVLTIDNSIEKGAVIHTYIYTNIYPTMYFAVLLFN